MSTYPPCGGGESLGEVATCPLFMVFFNLSPTELCNTTETLYIAIIPREHIKITVRWH